MFASIPQLFTQVYPAVVEEFNSEEEAKKAEKKFGRFTHFVVHKTQTVFLRLHFMCHVTLCSCKVKSSETFCPMVGSIFWPDVKTKVLK